VSFAWFSQAFIAAERRCEGYEICVGTASHTAGARLSRVCSRMLACGLCAIDCREAGVPSDHAGATRGVCPARASILGRCAWRVCGRREEAGTRPNARLSYHVSDQTGITVDGECRHRAEVPGKGSPWVCRVHALRALFNGAARACRDGARGKDGEGRSRSDGSSVLGPRPFPAIDGGGARRGKEAMQAAVGRWGGVRSGGDGLSRDGSWGGASSTMQTEGLAVPDTQSAGVLYRSYSTRAHMAGVEQGAHPRPRGGRGRHAVRPVRAECDKKLGDRGGKGRVRPLCAWLGRGRKGREEQVSVPKDDHECVLMAEGRSETQEVFHLRLGWGQRRCGGGAAAGMLRRVEVRVAAADLGPQTTQLRGESRRVEESRGESSPVDDDLQSRWASVAGLRRGQGRRHGAACTDEQRKTR